MALLQISEPGQSLAPHQRKRAVGIDLGTTNSLVAAVRNGIAEVLPDDKGENILPSVVRYLKDGNVQVGTDAKNSAIADPQNTIVSVKRLMGRGKDDIQSVNQHTIYTMSMGDSTVPRIVTEFNKITAVEVSAEILKVLKLRAEETLGGELAGAVITVPAYFDDAQRHATKEAAMLAGLPILRLLNEPTAAAIAYGLDKSTEGIIAVYDLGGGTFDISILQLRKGVFEVLATAGDTALGGDDFDNLMVHWLIEKTGIETPLSNSLSRQLMNVAAKAKEELSSSEATVLNVTLDDGRVWQGEVTRDFFESLIEPLVKKTLSPCRRALADANLKKDDITEVVMVGGSTRVPLIRKRVSEFFAREVLTDINPDEVVAIGASIQADILAGNKSADEMLLLDVIPLSLGLETMGGLVEKIIPRNSTLPISKTQNFTTFKDGQTSLSIHIVQGERELVDDCRSLAKFELRNIPPMVAGVARIAITFQVDADGLLSVVAEELNSGVETSIIVKPSYGLDDTEIEEMLKNSVAYAKEDMRLRKLKEQQVDAQRVLEALDAALATDGKELLSEQEIADILKYRTALSIMQNDSNADLIKNAIHKLEDAAQIFVERRMNSGIRKAVSSHSINEYTKEL